MNNLLLGIYLYIFMNIFVQDKIFSRLVLQITYVFVHFKLISKKKDNRLKINLFIKLIFFFFLLFIAFNYMLRYNSPPCAHPITFLPLESGLKGMKI